MRKVCVVLTVFFSVAIAAQSKNVLLKHNGDKIEGNYIRTENNILYFSKANSTEENALSRFSVQSILDKVSNKIQIVSTKVNPLVSKEVILLKESETIGLIKGESITVFLGRNKGFSNYDLVQLKTRRLQEQASKKNSPFVIITSESYEYVNVVLYHY